MARASSPTQLRGKTSRFDSIVEHRLSWDEKARCITDWKLANVDAKALNELFKRLIFSSNNLRIAARVISDEASLLVGIVLDELT